MRAKKLPTVPGAIGDKPDPNPTDSQERGFFKFILKNVYIQNLIPFHYATHHTRLTPKNMWSFQLK